MISNVCLGCLRTSELVDRPVPVMPCGSAEMSFMVVALGGWFKDDGFFAYTMGKLDCLGTSEPLGL